MSKRSQGNSREGNKGRKSPFDAYFESFYPKPIPFLQLPDLGEASKNIVAALNNIRVPTLGVYTKAEHERIRAELQSAKRQVEESKRIAEESESKTQRELLRQVHSRYFSKTAVEEIIQGKKQLRTGERQEMTVLDCDIRKFTRFTNEVDPEYLTELLNEYLVKCTMILQNHNGAVDKYQGDGILAYFGCLDRTENHALSACKAAMAIVDWKNQNSIFQRWYDKLTKVPEPRYLGIGIGIATGPVYWDYIGTPSRQELTIIGKHVNLVSRLQSVAEAGEILISNITRGKVEGEFATERVKDRTISLPGFEGHVDVFRLKSKNSR